MTELTSPRAITDIEKPWVELARRRSLDNVRDVLHQQGVTSWTQAGAIAFWLKDQAEGFRLVDEATCTRYRKKLATIGPPLLRTIPGYRDLSTAAAA